MTMPFGHVGIEHVSICFTAPHARGPLGSWSTWSPLLVDHHMLKLISIFSPLSSPTCRVGAHVPREGHRFDLALNQQSSTKVRACFAVYRALHAYAPLVHRARLPTSDDNLCRYNPYWNYAHTQFTRTAHLPEAHLERFHRLPGAPAPWPRHPFVVECMRVF
jgi:hypothetical protein